MTSSTFTLFQHNCNANSTTRVFVSVLGRIDKYEMGLIFRVCLGLGGGGKSSIKFLAGILTSSLIYLTGNGFVAVLKEVHT